MPASHVGRVREPSTAGAIYRRLMLVLVPISLLLLMCQERVLFLKRGHALTQQVETRTLPEQIYSLTWILKRQVGVIL